MDIGTAKPTIEQRKEITHHMIDICPPDHIMTVAEFQRSARKCIDDILNRGKIPFLVGGSGLYIRSVIDDLHFADNIFNKRERDKLKNRIETEGLKSLYMELIKVDEEYSKKIGSNDIRRIIRALEVYYTSGKKFSSFQKQWKERKSIYDLTMIGLNKNRDELYNDIEKRVDNMISSGLFDEVEGLIKKGYGNKFALKQAIGYREVLSFFNDELTKEEAIKLIKKNTRNFAKRQLTWLRADPRVNWFFIKKNKKFDSIINKIIEIVF
ncbi:tRNA dimethylallyltransferase [subsurface metagenome]